VLNAGYAITVNGNLTAAVARQNNKNCRCGIWATTVRTEAEDRQNAAERAKLDSRQHTTAAGFAFARSVLLVRDRNGFVV
jgi:hypothetical protein